VIHAGTVVVLIVRLNGRRIAAPVVAPLERAWPVLEATDLMGDLWSVQAYLRRCTPRLAAAERRRRVPGAHDAQWQRLLRHCPSRNVTVVGDPGRAASRERPDVRTQHRRTGPVRHGSVAELDDVVGGGWRRTPRRPVRCRTSANRTGSPSSAWAWPPWR